MLQTAGMVDTRRLTTLFSAIGRGDWDETASTALEIVDSVDARGNRKAARTLRGALNGVAHQPSVRESSTSESSSLSQILVRCPAGPPLVELVHGGETKQLLADVRDEWAAQDALAAAGLQMRRRLLFHGPPGCGKTVTAAALAAELGIPAYVVRFHALIGSFLGQTAVHLREVFQFAAQRRCVLLLDEIDVLGKQRGNQMDVGELDRIVVALMQELDLAKIRGLIIGATNLPQHLDLALWRRFELHLEFPMPTAEELVAYGKRLAKAQGVPFSATLRKRLAGAGDFAAAERSILNEARRRVIQFQKDNGKGKGNAQ